MEGGFMPYSILLIDDQASIRALYKAEFEGEGYKVHTASSGSIALDILEHELVNVVVLDIKLKGENGLQLLQKIAKKQKENPPVIISSAYSSYKNDFSSWLADAYVVKSSDINELKQEVSRTLKRHYGTRDFH